MGVPTPSSDTTGRPRVGAGTPAARRAAIDADAAAARSGAQAAKQKRHIRKVEQQPGSDTATSDLSALNAASTIKKKQAKDKRVIEEMSQ